MFGGAGAGLHGYGAQGCGAALGEDDAVDTGSIGDAEKCAEVLRVFDAIERKNETRRSWRRRIALVEIFDGEKLLRVDEGDDALVRRGSSELGKLIARLLPHTHTGLAAVGDEARQAIVLTFAGNEDVVKAAAAGLERLLHRMHAVKKFHRR